ncbi:hypothetical protein NIES4103_41990 [Nostoc sp. NIES-4103]|nr:hypothetical protein NIES4103_41990 [Nostoc sp. NIES-4103]
MNGSQDFKELGVVKFELCIGVLINFLASK